MVHNLPSDSLAAWYFKNDPEGRPPPAKRCRVQEEPTPQRCEVQEEPKAKQPKTQKPKAQQDGPSSRTRSRHRAQAAPATGSVHR